MCPALPEAAGRSHLSRDSSPIPAGSKTRDGQRDGLYPRLGAVQARRFSTKLVLLLHHSPGLAAMKGSGRCRCHAMLSHAMLCCAVPWCAVLHLVVSTSNGVSGHFADAPDLYWA